MTLALERTLIIDDKAKTPESDLDFTVLRKLCEKYNLWPRKVILRKARPSEKKEPGNNTGYYVLGYFVFVIFERKYTKKYFDHLQAHEFRHMLQIKRPWLNKMIHGERVETVRKMLLAILSLGPVTQELLGIDNENVTYYDPEELDADFFAAEVVRYLEPYQKFEKRKNKNENTTPVTSSIT